ncbi:HMBX1 protein, partial [Atractosteus spatula]|nr:HMBX1 protein [Atractosteus spatula]
MSHYTDEPRFTIEQIDLLQRLRRTGMTKHEILHALDTLDRLDREHGDKFGRRPAYGGGGLSPSPSNSYDTSPPPSAATANQNGRESMSATPNGKLSPSRYTVNSVGARSYSFEATEEDLDIDDKVEELMRRDSSIIKEEIKAFLANRRISQAVVAQVTGISQSRISHWLLQQGSDLSEQKKRAFYRWYQLEKTTPGISQSRISHWLLQQGSDLSEQKKRAFYRWYQLEKTTPGVSLARTWMETSWEKHAVGRGVSRASRGSSPCVLHPLTPISLLNQGFTVLRNKECLAVMESYFNENQYPDEAKREEIANACNAVIQKPGKKLSDLERVTSLKVYNWFANRRKEIKRRANIVPEIPQICYGKVCFFEEAAILESHGIDVQSPGGHSNSDDIDGNDYSEQGGGRPCGNRRPDDNTSHSDHQDPISLAVEMAAVNHTILALARQGGAGEIKTEVLDDD